MFALVLRVCKCTIVATQTNDIDERTCRCGKALRECVSNCGADVHFWLLPQKEIIWSLCLYVFVLWRGETLNIHLCLTPLVPLMGLDWTG